MDRCLFILRVMTYEYNNQQQQESNPPSSPTAHKSSSSSFYFFILFKTNKIYRNCSSSTCISISLSLPFHSRMYTHLSTQTTDKDRMNGLVLGWMDSSFLKDSSCPRTASGYRRDTTRPGSWHCPRARTSRSNSLSARSWAPSMDTQTTKQKQSTCIPIDERAHMWYHGPQKTHHNQTKSPNTQQIATNQVHNTCPPSESHTITYNHIQSHTQHIHSTHRERQTSL